MNEIQRSLNTRGKEVQHEVSPTFSDHRPKLSITHSFQRVTHGSDEEVTPPYKSNFTRFGFDSGTFDLTHQESKYDRVTPN